MIYQWYGIMRSNNDKTPFQINKDGDIPSFPRCIIWYYELIHIPHMYWLLTIEALVGTTVFKKLHQQVMCTSFYQGKQNDYVVVLTISSIIP